MKTKNTRQIEVPKSDLALWKKVTIGTPQFSRTVEGMCGSYDYFLIEVRSEVMDVMNQIDKDVTACVEEGDENY